MSNPFDIEEQFQHYMKLVGLDKNRDKVAPNQIAESRAVFYGAWGQLLVLLKEDMPDDEEECRIIFQNMMDQVLHFFTDRAAKAN